MPWRFGVRECSRIIAAPCIGAVAAMLTGCPKEAATPSAKPAVTVEVSPSIPQPAYQLPEMVRPPKSPDYLILVVEINAKAEVVVKGRDPIVQGKEIKDHLVEEYERLKRVADDKKVPFDPELVIRAHKDARFTRIHEVMQLAKEVGFKKVQMRATQ
jgi:biopolymer transport protein ExbD